MPHPLYSLHLHQSSMIASAAKKRAFQKISIEIHLRITSPRNKHFPEISFPLISRVPDVQVLERCVKCVLEAGRLPMSMSCTSASVKAWLTYGCEISYFSLAISRSIVLLSKELELFSHYLSLISIIACPWELSLTDVSQLFSLFLRHVAKQHCFMPTRDGNK